MKIFITTFCVLILLTSCTKSKPVADPLDYDSYLKTNNTAMITSLEAEAAFWNKRILVDSLQIIDISKSAGIYSQLFQENADISQLKKAEKNLSKAAQVAAINKDNYLISLAQNYITQHRFKEAAVLIDSAQTIAGGETSSINFIMFDVAMELGDYKAKSYLDKETDFASYNYLIRLAKWEDYQGNLDKTIQHMESAKGIAESGKQDALLLWVYTNLADYYGHAGRITDAYSHYMKALEIAPTNAYAKKGIAWIAYAHDRNPEEALRIIASIETYSKSPDYDLLKAEIYESMDNAKKSTSLKDKFMNAVKNPAYGDMYNAYLIDILASSPNTAARALDLAKQEIKNRATPETYDLLSYAYLGMNEPQKALDIQKKHVIGKTHEPVAQLHLAQIYKALNMSDNVSPLKEELLEAAFELGPVTHKTVKNL